MPPSAIPPSATTVKPQSHLRCRTSRDVFSRLTTSCRCDGWSVNDPLHRRRLNNEEDTLQRVFAIYVRVSSKQQDQRSQEPDLNRWAARQEGDIVWYRDKFTGKTMQRPGMDRLMVDMRAGKIS